MNKIKAYIILGFLFMFLLSALLTSCGQTGKLYLPPAKTSKAK